MPEPADRTCTLRTISCFHWRRLREAFSEVFPHIPPEHVAHLLMEHRKRIGIAEAGGEMAGFYQFEARPEKRVAWLNYIGVRPAFRSSGIGKRLLDAFETHALRDGFGTFELDVLEENETAIRFYERHGYDRILAHEHKGRKKLRYAKSPQVEGLSPAGVGSSSPGLSFAERKYWRLVYLVLVDLPRGFR